MGNSGSLRETDRAGQDLASMSVWEPACGRGHMARPLADYFGTVYVSDIHPYGYGEVCDFLSEEPQILRQRSGLGG